jgi:membrane protease YdiL (CAAX protease family)
MGAFGASVRRLTFQRDPVLLQGREQRWRWPWAIAGLVLSAFLFLGLGAAVVTFEALAERQKWIAGGFPQNVFPIDPAQPITFLDLLFSSLPFLLVPLVVLAVVHGVSWRRAFSYAVGFQWRQFANAALALLLIALLGIAAGYLYEPQQYAFPPHVPLYAMWVALTLVVVLVQSLGEEVMFRGYLVRVLGAVFPFRIPVTAAVIAAFVTGHLWNEDLQRDLMLNVIYFVAVEIISYVVLFRTQNLAASAGLHWMNNVIALLAPTVPGQPTPLALVVYTDPVYMAGGSRLVEPLTHATSILGVALLLGLLLWRRSPLYLAPVPAPAPAPSQAADAPAA